jgi:carbamoyl-phosphate synthase large subunit
MIYNIGVTGTGGGVGQSIIKCLQNTDYSIVALDSDPSSVGLNACNRSFVIPRSDSQDYIEQLLSICESQKIQVLFPGLDIELSVLSNSLEKFEKIGTKVVVSDPSVVQIANDKWKTYEFCNNNYIGRPRTSLLKNFDASSAWSFPCVVKQRLDGTGSRNVFFIKDLEAYSRLDINKIKDHFIAQERIDGDEYTCGAIMLDGVYYGCIVMKRVLRNGDTSKCFVKKNEVIEQYVKDIMASLKPYGACNIQLKMRNGAPFLMEINARCSGTTAARSLCGFNEPKMICDYILKQVAPVHDIQEKVILRYWTELESTQKSIEELRDSKKRISQNSKTL